MIWWPGKNEDIDTMISKCRPCQITQSNLLEKGLITSPKIESLFQRVHIDFFHFKDKTFLLAVDSKSIVKWMDVHLMHATDATYNKNYREIKLTFSLIGLIVSDNGPLILLSFKFFVNSME